MGALPTKRNTSAIAKRILRRIPGARWRRVAGRRDYGERGNASRRPPLPAAHCARLSRSIVILNALSHSVHALPHGGALCPFYVGDHSGSYAAVHFALQCWQWPWFLCWGKGEGEWGFSAHCPTPRRRVFPTRTRTILTSGDYGTGNL